MNKKGLIAHASIKRRIPRDRSQTKYRANSESSGKLTD